MKKIVGVWSAVFFVLFDDVVSVSHKECSVLNDGIVNVSRGYKTSS